MQSFVRDCVNFGAALSRHNYVDLKGELSPVLYARGIAASFYRPWIGRYTYTLVALIWLVPDRRLERALK